MIPEKASKQNDDTIKACFRTLQNPKSGSAKSLEDFKWKR